MLEFSVTFPTPLSFVETYMQAMQITDLPTELFTKFLLEMSLLDFRMLRFPPSTQALAALVVTVQAL